MRHECAEDLAVAGKQWRCLDGTITGILCELAIRFVFRVFGYVANDYPGSITDRSGSSQARVDRNRTHRFEEFGVESPMGDYLKDIARGVEQFEIAELPTQHQNHCIQDLVQSRQQDRGNPGLTLGDQRCFGIIRRNWLIGHLATRVVNGLTPVELQLGCVTPPDDKPTVPKYRALSRIIFIYGRPARGGQ